MAEAEDPRTDRRREGEALLHAGTTARWTIRDPVLLELVRPDPADGPGQGLSIPRRSTACSTPATWRSRPAGATCPTAPATSA